MLHLLSKAKCRRNVTCTAAILSFLLTTSATSAPAQSLQIWSDLHDSPFGQSDGGVDLALDANGGLVVVASTAEQIPGGGGGTAYRGRVLLMRYVSGGVLDWETIYAPANAQSSVQPHRVLIDSQNYIWVSGSMSSEWILLQFRPNGTLRWSNTLPSGGFPQYQSQDIALGPSGDVYFVGDNGATTTVARYDELGTRLWSFVDDLPSGATGSGGRRIAVSASEEIYVTGDSTVPGAGTEMMLFKLSATGTLLWSVATGDSGAGASDRGRDVIVDGNGDVLVVGSRGGNTVERSDLAVWKYSAQGDLIWERRFGQSGVEEWGENISVDAYDGVTVVGHAANITDLDALVVRYDAQGNLVYGKVVGSEPGWDDDFDGVVATSDGGAYITGNATLPLGAPTATMALTLRLAPNGEELWRHTIGSHPSYGRALVTDGQGTVFVTGSSGWASNQASDVLSFRLFELPGTATPAPPRQSLHVGSASPNPFNPRTRIAFSLDSATTLRAEIFDSRGRRVWSSPERRWRAGSHEILWDGTDDTGRSVSSGSYRFRISGGGNSIVRALTLIR